MILICVLSLVVQCLDLIESSRIMASQLCEDVDLHIMMHRAYGKGFIKTCKVSPDAYIQLALQLAYYRVSGGSCGVVLSPRLAGRQWIAVWCCRQDLMPSATLHTTG